MMRMMKMRPVAGRGRIIDALTMLVLALVSLLLLLYVGYGEGKRATTTFRVSKLVAQGQVIQNKIEEYLRSGQPLGQFAGFRSLAQPLLESDPALASLIVRAPSGAHLFEIGVAIKEGDPPSFPQSSVDHLVHLDSDHLHVILPLRNKFETGGSLVVSVKSAAVTEAVDAAFLALLPWCVFLCLALAAFAYTIAHWPRKRRALWHRALFAGAFLATNVAVVLILLNIYSDGARSKARAMADSLNARLNEISDLGLSIEDFSGINQAMVEYRRLNPDIGAVAVVEDGVALLHTNPAAQGRAWVSDRSTFEFTAPLRSNGQTGRSQVVMVTMPFNVVYWAIARNVKNFLALFVATGLIALVFLKLADTRPDEGRDSPATDDRRLEFIGPLLFVGVFVDNLSAPFLPQLVRNSAQAAGMPSLAVSIVFLLYFLAFSLSMLPAESFAARRGPKPLIWSGAALAALGSALLAASHGFALVALARVLSGAGQGMLLIGVQSFIFAVAAPERRTHGNGIIVFNFNGGMVAGMAIGSLLVLTLNETGVFALAAAVMTALACYAAISLPVLERAVFRPMPDLSGLWRVLFDRGFLECVLLVGIPSKMLLSGVIIFAMPLLLETLNYRHEDIGQLVMFYAGGVMLANALITRVVGLDRATGRFLTRGMLLSAAGLAMIGLVGWNAVINIHSMPFLVSGLVLGGVAALGVAHGFINAPVVTHVTTLPIATAVGVGPVAALYRMVERIGHVSGPVIIGQLLLLRNYDPIMLLIPAAIVMVAAMVFRLSPSGKERTP
jgi:MFS family permease